MKTKAIFSILIFLPSLIFAQNLTDVSLFYRSDSVYVNEISDPSGDLYKKVGHHGPALENEFMALRIYFNNKACSIDAYNKQKPGLELKKYKWYPTEDEQRNSSGADYYKVGSTVGLGGVRLWDGEKMLPLAPITMRTARVRKFANVSEIEMLSENVPYKGDSIDVLVRITAFSGIREMKVEAFAFCDNDVQFITGLNYYKDGKVEVTDDHVITWGYHPEDVAIMKMEVGAAIIVNPQYYRQTVDDGKQKSFITKPTKYTCHWVTSTISYDETLNTFKKFKDYVLSIQ